MRALHPLLLLLLLPLLGLAGCDSWDWRRTGADWIEAACDSARNCAVANVAVE